MKTKTAITIDHLFGTPLCWILNLITHGIGLVLRRNHKPPYNVKKVLFIKLMGIGSIVEALPLIEATSRRYPQADVRMLCFPETKIFAERIRHVSSVWTIDRKSLLRLAWSSLKAILEIILWRPDLVFDLEYHSKFSSLLTTMTCALNRAGLFDVSTRFRDYLYTHLVYANPQRHIADLYNHLGRVFETESFRTLNACGDLIIIKPSEEKELEQTLSAYGIKEDADLIVINVNAADLCLERRWPPKYFAALAEELCSSGPILLVGSPSERNYVESVRGFITNEQALGKVHNLAGDLSFGAFLALLKRAEVVITNDSGPMHLAALLDTYVVSLWGPGFPATYAPRTTKHIALWENVFCSPCLYIVPTPPCGGDNICMKSLSVEKVLKTVYRHVPTLAESDKNKPQQPATHLEEAYPLPGVIVRTMNDLKGAAE